MRSQSVATIKTRRRTANEWRAAAAWKSRQNQLCLRSSELLPRPNERPNRMSQCEFRPTNFLALRARYSEKADRSSTGGRARNSNGVWSRKMRRQAFQEAPCTPRKTNFKRYSQREPNIDQRERKREIQIKKE